MRRDRTNSPSSHSVSSGYVDSSDMASPLLIMRTELFECSDEPIRRRGENHQALRKSTDQLG